MKSNILSTVAILIFVKKSEPNHMNLGLNGLMCKGSTFVQNFTYHICISNERSFVEFKDLKISVFALVVHFFNYFSIKSLLKMILYHTQINRSSNNIT